MNEVKRGFGQRISNDIVLSHLNILGGQRLQKPRVDVRDDDVSRGADTIREPRGDRASTSPHFQAPPAFAYAAILQMANCAAIKHAGQSIESRWRLSIGVI
jgi:hypothetical protein